MSRQARWNAEKAWKWHEQIGTLKGVNYIPRTAVNTIEMWQEETFDEKTIEEELNWAEKIKLNSVRVFVHYLVYEAGAQGLKKRLRRFLEIAARHGIRTMFVLFDDCWNQQPILGPQPPPIPSVHNSRWVASPGRAMALDRKLWSPLEAFVKDIIGAFACDERVAAWDIYNEPGNSGMGEKSLPLVEAAFQWARTVSPSQPLTVGLWANFDNAMHHRFAELSDVIPFHAYEPLEGVAAKIAKLQHYARPMLCTEFLHRPVGNTFGAILPLFAKHRVGWYFWGLVAGKTQTFLHWSSKPNDPPPKVWQHDLLHPGGTPYDPSEISLLTRWAKQIR